MTHSPPGRRRSAVADRLESALLGGTLAHWRDHFAGQDVCCEPVLDVDQVLDDAQVRHRADAVDGQLAWFPFHVGDHGHAPQGQAPGYGADSRTVLAEVGVDDGEFERLVAERVTA